jgi:TonB family protein
MKTRTTTRYGKTRLWIFVFLALLAVASTAAPAQDSEAPEHARKVVRRVMPAYPELARPMRLNGTVRLVAVVAPNGSVKSVEPVGGNAVLVKAAQDAVMKWKYVASSEESKEQIELHFSPE